MDEATEKTWPREIWMAEREAYDHGVVTAVLSEHATIARWDGDKERDREFHRYVDGDIHDTAERYYKAILEAERNAKDARIAELEAAIKRQAGAAKTLRNLTLAEVQHIKDNERKQYLAIKTLDSERDANAILTEENEALQARIAELEAENREMAMQCLASDGQAQMAYEEQERLEAKLAKVSKSGQAVVDRWDSIDWKDQNHTADYINDLRATLADLQKPIATRDDPA